MWSVIKYERSVITKTLLRFTYLVYDLSNYVDDTLIKISLSFNFAFRACAATSFSFAFVRVQQPAERYALACDSAGIPSS
jgi:hypothetical protein